MIIGGPRLDAYQRQREDDLRRRFPRRTLRDFDRLETIAVALDPRGHDPGDEDRAR